jgi:hypothetical protein
MRSAWSGKRVTRGSGRHPATTATTRWSGDETRKMLAQFDPKVGNEVRNDLG